jgi:hypothetical protein
MRTNKLYDYEEFYEILKIKVYPKRKAWDIYIRLKKAVDIKELKALELKISKLYDIPKVRLVRDIKPEPKEIEEIIISDTGQFYNFTRNSYFRVY